MNRGRTPVHVSPFILPAPPFAPILKKWGRAWVLTGFTEPVQEEADVPRAARKVSESGLYHVMARGASRQVIFEDDADRRSFLAFLAKGCEECGVRLLAYVLMGNHLHLVAGGSVEDVSNCMRRVTGEYAAKFNGRHGRCGHLFQDRFKSEPIEDDGYLLTVIRYVHQNPEVAGLAKTADWPWSSYREYIGKASLIDSEIVLDMLGGVDGFVKFHAQPHGGKKPIECEDHVARKRLSDEEAIAAARDLLGRLSLESLSGLPKGERDEAVGKLRCAGLGVRQIQRLTGISLGAISKARP